MGLKQILLLLAGFLCLGFGSVGVVLPGLPTTPFVLLAAACFSASNEKMARWLEKNRVFGPYIENYRTRAGIPLWLKCASIASLWTGLITSMVLTQAVWAYILLGIIGIGVTVHLLMIKTKKK